ncbi:venom acid phosphatase Acph-1-like [Microplitis mediator]|uniref:venom acid phosphatase Acph-1-like n=1 Tax=Microplitis mediator TaxID=375433 RepID=UPI002555D6D1|nr:venom acid phosphatase Acph-1-like [Microplitis mediator]
MFALWILVLFFSRSVLSDQELKLVHVVFSHKMYAPIQINQNNTFMFPEKLDYKYFLESTDDMVNSAKLDMYNLGVFLRQRYNYFLGDIFHPEIMRMRTTEYPLSMISGLLVDAGLWPPAEAQKWEANLNWQPVPTDYLAADRDTLLLGSLCPSFIEDEKKAQVAKTSDEHKLLYSTLTENYGSKIEKPSDVALLLSTFRTIVDSNLSLPTWAKELYPDKLLDATFLSYEQLAETKRQIQLNGGTLLQKIINNSMAHEKSNGTSKLKILMYSAEERTLIGLLKIMNSWSPHILSPAAALLFEVYADSVTNKYAIKMMFYTYNETVPFHLQNCSEYCLLEDYSTQLKSVLPENATALCQLETSKNPNSSPILTTNTILLFILLSFTIINVT